MTFVSYQFALFLPAVAALFYVCPKRWRMGTLLLASGLFLILSGGVRSLAVYGFSVFVAWAAALGSERFREEKGGVARLLFWAAVVILLGLLAGFQYINFPGYTAQEFFWLIGREYDWTPIQTVAPTAISFYTLSLLGYLVEVRWGVIPAERNPVKLALFGGFFPQMAMGPIVRYGTLSETLFSGKGAGAERFLGGLQRILWGLFQKLVISERLRVIVDTVYSDCETFGGWYLVLAAAAFAFQLYTDFAGAMDIALGAAGLFGVKLPENFRQPFCSRSIAEFWRRWHMTLGAWFKDFVMYPLLKTDGFQRLGDWGKRHFGKKQGKKIPTVAALLIVWFLLGLWHGGKWTFIIGSGLYHAVLMAAALLTEPWQKKFYSLTGMNKENPVWVFFQRVRTFVLVSAGFVLFRSDSLKMAGEIFKGMFSGNAGQLAAEGFGALGLNGADGAVLLLSLGLLGAVSHWKEVHGNQEGKPEIRGAVCAILAFAILIFGFYGRGYDPSAFIYARF